MPRTSSASLSIVRPSPRPDRPRPPAELTDEEAHEWREVVNRLPPDWFPRETHPQLANYCRHVVQRRVLAGLIHQTVQQDLDERANIARYERLLAMAEKETRAINALARSMRLTLQSRYRADHAEPKARGSTLVKEADYVA